MVLSVNQKTTERASANQSVASKYQFETPSQCIYQFLDLKMRMTFILISVTENYGLIFHLMLTTILSKVIMAMYSCDFFIP